jgi:hypothetical protein
MDDHALATVELLGSLAYGQLRSFAATASTIPLAPDTAMADRLATWASTEYERYRRLRDHLRTRTELSEAVMERQRGPFDHYFDRAPLDDWFGACVFFALGLPIASDFVHAIAPTLDEEAATVVLGSLEREEVEAEAIEQLSQLLVDDEARERARSLTADLLGRALTGFQGVIADTDALEVLLASDRRDGETGEQRVKRLALDVLQGHRRRVIALGLEDLEDVT